jgi:hypothetical protein
MKTKIVLLALSMTIFLSAKSQCFKAIIDTNQLRTLPGGGKESPYSVEGTNVTDTGTIVTLRFFLTVQGIVWKGFNKMEVAYIFIPDVLPNGTTKKQYLQQQLDVWIENNYPAH